MGSPSPFFRRFLALSLLGVVIMLMWNFVVDPLTALWDGAGEDISKAAHYLAAYDRTLHNQPAMESLLSQMQQEPYKGIFIEAADADLAASHLQKNVKQITEAAGGVVNSIQILQSGKEHELQRVGVAVSMVIPTGQLPKLLTSYDRARPVVFLDNLSILVAGAVTSSRRGPVGTNKSGDHLIVSGNLYAYVLPGAL